MKAVLVLNSMPDGCVNCPLCYLNAEFEVCCLPSERKAMYVVGVDKPEWCPLRPMPKNVYYGRDCSEWDDGYQTGVAATLRAIEGSVEGWLTAEDIIKRLEGKE